MENPLNISSHMQKTNTYMKRVFWLIIVCTSLQLYQGIRTYRAIPELSWQSVLMSMLLNVAIIAFVLFVLYKMINAYKNFFEHKNTANLVQAVNHEAQLFNLLKIFTWVGLVALIALMFLTLVLGFRAYNN